MTHPTIGSTVAHKVPVLHVHGQDEPKDAVIIVGNRDGIRALRAACDIALMDGENSEARAAVARLFDRNGDAYSALITVYTTAGMLDQPLPEYRD